MTIKFGDRAAFTLLLFAFVILITSLTLGLGRVARLVPLAVAVPTLVALALQLLLDLSPRLAQTYRRLEKRDLFSVETLRAKSQARAVVEETEEKAQRDGSERQTFLWLLLLLPLVHLFGFLMALSLYVFLYFRGRADAGWLLSAAAAAGMGGLLYSVFILALGIHLYEGLLWDWLSK